MTTQKSKGALKREIETAHNWIKVLENCNASLHDRIEELKKELSDAKGCIKVVEEIVESANSRIQRQPCWGTNTTYNIAVISHEAILKIRKILTKPPPGEDPGKATGQGDEEKGE